jgi:two-component system NtrC family response regulator
VTQTKQKLLIIEDDPGLQKQLRWSFDAYDVVVAGDRESALAQIRRHEPAVVTMDLGLPPDPDGSTEGLATLQQILALAPDTRVIVLTGNQERGNAVKAIAMGAYDFHQKPCDPEVLGLVIERAFFLNALQQENRRMQLSQADSPMSGVISRDAGMLKVCRNIEKVAPTSASVMILGESGTGKEVPPSRPRARSSWRTAALSSSTRWATCRWRCRPSCCASCRSAWSSGLAATRRSQSTCGSSAPPTRSSRT